MDVLNPTPALLAQIGSILIHVEEMLSPQGHQFDKMTLEGLLESPDVQEWLEAMGAMALIPLKRSPKAS